MISNLQKMPPNWIKVRFDEIAENITDRIDKPNESGLKYYIGLDHLDKDQIRIKRFGSTEDVNATKFLCKKGDIIFGKRNAYLRKVAVTDRDAVVSAHSMVIRPAGDLLVPYFLPCFMQSSIFWKMAHAISEGSMSPTIKWKTLAKQEFWIPTIEEQKKISKVLWSIEDNIEKTEKLIEIAEKLKKGLFNELVARGIGHTKFKQTEIGNIPTEWEVVKVSDVFEVITGSTPSTKEESFWFPQEINWYTPLDLGRLDTNIFLADSNKKISRTGLEKTNLKNIPKNTVLISTRAPVGYVGITTTSATINQGCKAIRPKEKESFEFYANYFIHSTKRLESFSGGSTFKELTKKSLEEFQIVHPSFQEQDRIQEKVKSITSSILSLEENKEKLGNMKKKLTDDILKGEVWV